MSSKQMEFITRGMRKDNSPSVSSKEFAYDNQNIRYVVTDNQTLALENERGTRPVEIIFEDSNLTEIPGTVIGQAILDNEWVLFVTGEKDYILKLVENGDALMCTILYSGNLNFSEDSPIETLVDYESSDVKKVYWVDGVNLLRFISIDAPEDVRKSWTDESFDSSVSIDIPSVTIQKTTGGSFSGGAIQYMCTYLNQFGVETPPFYVSSLWYTTDTNRGVNAEDLVNNAFKISIKYLSKKFQAVRVYSLLWTSLNGTPDARLVSEINIPDSLNIETFDYGYSGEVIDAASLLFLGGNSIIPYTLAQKDSVLFLGNIKEADKTVLDDDIRNQIKEDIKVWFVYGDEKDGRPNKMLDIPNATNSVYTNIFELDNPRDRITTFKYGEHYVFGVQLQYKSGVWGEVIPIQELTNNNNPPKVDNTSNAVASNRVRLCLAEYSITPSLENKLLELGYIAIRPVVHYPTSNERRVICQGVVSQTIRDEGQNQTTIRPSWFFRPYANFKDDDYYIVDATLEINTDTGYTFANQEEAEKAYNEYIKDLFSTEDEEKPLVEMSPNSNHDPNKYTNWGGTIHKVVIESEDGIDFSNESGNTQIRNRINVALLIESPMFRGILDDTLASTSTLEKEKLGTNINNLRFDGFIEVSNNETYHLYNHGTFISRCSMSYGTEYSHNSPVSLYTKDGFKYGSIDVLSEAQMCKAEIQTGDLYVDWNYFNMYSPDIDNITDTDISSAELRIVGAAPIMATSFNKKLLANNIYPWPGHEESKTQLVDINEYPKSFYKPPFRSIALWRDVSAIRALIRDDSYTHYHEFVIFPWHNSFFTDYNSALKTQLSEDAFRGEDQSKAVNNYTFNLRYSHWCNYVGAPKTLECETRIAQESDNLLNINSTSYEWNVPVAIPPSTFEATEDDIRMDNTPGLSQYNYGAAGGNSQTTAVGNPISWYYYWIKDADSKDPIFKRGYRVRPNELIIREYRVTSDLPIQLNYKTPTHIVGYAKEGIHPVYDVRLPSDYSNYVILGDLVVNKDFGNLEDLKYSIAGPSIGLGSSHYFFATEGDTFFQRWDCLKTFPLSVGEEGNANNVTEILSLMLETRTNVDGRWDRNRPGMNDVLNNWSLSSEIFNLINDVYSQENNFFSYNALNSFNINKYSNQNFKNRFVWSLPKVELSTVDNWLNITLANTYTLEGDKGAITKIKKLNNNLIAFQDRGISQILYNEQYQITSTEGVPIEMANSGRVSGVRYISSSVGCQNKWSISESPSGLYFVDDNSSTHYLFNGDLKNISLNYGMSSWFKNYNHLDKWDPAGFGNITSYYDPLTLDLMLITKDTALAFNEFTGSYSSFYTYGNTPYMVNIDNKRYAIHDNRIWELRAGDFNYFFGEYKPFSTTVIANQDMPKDKIFNTLEFRSNSWDESGMVTDNTFDKLRVWNEYQCGESELSTTGILPSLRRKFRIWRANIPRWNVAWNGKSPNFRDRMRNPWLFIKLSKEKENAEKTVLNDMTVHYFA